MEKFDFREEARKVWNCVRFNRKTHTCDGGFLCTGVFECPFFKEREDKKEAPKRWIEYCVRVHKDDC